MEDTESPSPPSDPIFQSDAQIGAYLLMYITKEGTRGFRSSPGLSVIDMYEMVCSLQLVLQSKYLTGVLEHEQTSKHIVQPGALVVPRGQLKPS